MGSGLVIGTQFWPIETLGYTLTIDGKQRTVFAEAKKNTIIITDDTGYRKKCSIAEFDAILDKKVQLTPHKRNKTFQIIGLFYVLSSICMLCLLNIRVVREKRLLSIIMKGKT